MATWTLCVPYLKHPFTIQQQTLNNWMPQLHRTLTWTRRGDDTRLCLCPDSQRSARCMRPVEALTDEEKEQLTQLWQFCTWLGCLEPVPARYRLDQDVIPVLKRLQANSTFRDHVLAKLQPEMQHSDAFPHHVRQFQKLQDWCARQSQQLT